MVAGSTIIFFSSDEADSLVYLSLYSERSQILCCTVVTNLKVHQGVKW